MSVNLMHLQNKIAPYLYDQLRQRVAMLPEIEDELIADAINMSHIGINSEVDHKNFFHILRHCNSIANNISARKLDQKSLTKLAHCIYANRQEFPIDTSMDFVKATRHALNKMQIPIKKMAYPTGENTLDTNPPHDIQKWMKSMKEIYALGQQSGDLSQAFDTVTSNWDKMEKQDFKYWLSFYEENAHNKYKMAQNKYYEAGPGAMIPIEHLKAKLPSAPDMGDFNQAAVDTAAQAKQRNKDEVNRKIKSIVSRLNAAERLATDPDVQRDLQQCLDIGVPKWLEELQRVKRLLQVVHIRSAASTTLEDIIFREANVLISKGCPKAGYQLKKLAQMPPSPDPTAMGGMTQESSPGAGGDEALDELIENMNDSNESLDDTNAIEDLEDDPLASITIIAQAVPPEKPTSEQGGIVPNTTLEVTEPDHSGSTLVDPKTDDIFEAALANVSIKDIIARLEILANVFRNREIPRQLAIVDLMMDKINISTFFPSLAEASSKALESNQYALSRIEEIISKLRGSVQTPRDKELNLVGDGVGPIAPIPEGATPDSIKQNLIQQDAAEKARKEKRQAEEAQPKPQQVAQVPEELAQPATIRR